jgi:hypothetical protein
MFIKEFYPKFAYEHERGFLFNALRRMSRLERPILLEVGERGWPEWPMDPDGPGLRLSRV